MSIKRFVPALGLLGLLAAVDADAAGVDAAHAGPLLDTLFLLLCGVLVMFMAAGFAMLEAGMVRSRSVAVICAKNISLYAMAGITFYLLGYQLMYGPSLLGLIGEAGVWAPQDASAGEATNGAASGAVWFFQMVFVATAASVVSGALAERVRFWPFLVFVAVLTGAIYPLVGHWTWGGGWLAQRGFLDFAGSTIVHAVGGCAALVGAVIAGPRRGRFSQSGAIREMPPSSLPYVTLGTFILWLGWFGFNGGSQLAFSSTADAIAVSTIFVNTNLAAAGGVLAMLAASRSLSRRLDLPLVLNGALAGLVSITAEPLAPTGGQAMLIGAAGAVLMMLGSRLLRRFRIDDVVDAVPVHLVAGVWGTLAVTLTNPEANLLAQATGIVAIIGFVAVASAVAWMALKRAIGIRLRSAHETEGADLTEVGLRAYDFS